MAIEIFGIAGESSDVHAIVEVVAALEAAQQQEKPDDFMRLFSKQDPVWTTAFGTRISGWDAIRQFTYEVLPGAMRDSTAIYRVARILFIRPDVAAVNVHQQPIYPDGRPLEDIPEGRPFYIMSKEEGEWKIAAAQNTRVKA